MHRAGQLLRAWRSRQTPALSVEQFAARYGFKAQTVFGWEAKGRIARAGAQRKLAELQGRNVIFRRGPERFSYRLDTKDGEVRIQPVPPVPPVPPGAPRPPQAVIVPGTSAQIRSARVASPALEKRLDALEKKFDAVLDELKSLRRERER